MKQIASILTLSVLFSAAYASSVLAREEMDTTTFTLQPYIWLPTIDAEIRYSTLPNGSSGSPEIKVDPDDLLENLDLAVLLNGEIRKGKWSLHADLVYMKVSSGDSMVKAVNFGGTKVRSTLNLDTDIEIENFIISAGVGYQIVDKERFSADLLAGGRYLWLESDADWHLSADVVGPLAGHTFSRNGDLVEDGEVWNGIVGVKGQFQLGNSNWHIPFYADVGTGDSDLTWQIFAALGYSFHAWEFKAGYRYLTFEGKDDDLVQQLTVEGPIVGASFSF